MKNKLPTPIIFILVILTLSVIYMLYVIDDVSNNISNEIKTIEIQYAQEYSKNIKEIIANKCDCKLTECVKNNKSVRNELNKILSGFATSQFKYVYIVTLDKKGKFRYLLDGSKDIKDRGMYQQIFIPESDIWFRAYEEGKQKWSIQSNVTGIWLTFLSPVVYDNNTNALIAMDISIQEFSRITELVNPIKSLLLFLAVVIIISVLITIFQTFALYKIHRKSIIDPLTGLFNRNFLNLMKNKFKSHNFCVAITDIDNFKKINDAYGHDFGDKVLIEFAKRLKDSVRSNDYLTRYGGEEFLLFFYDKGNHEGIIKALERIKDRITNQPFEIDSVSIDITASFGLNISPNISDEIEQSINLADKMLYLAKTNGRNRIEVYKGKMQSFPQHFNRIENVLKLINNNNIKVFYQPILNLKSNKIDEFEALVRLVDNDNSIISPKMFIPIIKKSDAYKKMCQVVVENAFDTIKKYNINVNINLDIEDLLDDVIFDMLIEKAHDNKDATRYLTIELFKNQIKVNINKISEKAKSLKKLGMRIALDDFGSGFSNYDNLIDLQPDIVKIDGNIIKKITKNENAYNIVISIQEICKKLNIITTAEFVENREIFLLVKDTNIDFAQGYFIGKPKEDIEI